MFIQFENSFIEADMPNKIILLLTLMKFRLSMAGELITSIESLASGIGYLPNSKKGHINEDIKTCLEWLELHNYIFVLDKSVATVRPKELFIIQINRDNDIFMSDSVKNNFVQFRYSEFEKIANWKTLNNKGYLTLMFLNIKKRMNLSDIGNGYSYPSQERLSLECGLSARGKISSSLINDLVNMKLLYRFNAGSYLTRDGDRRNANTLYSLEPIDKKSALIELCTYYHVKNFNPIAKPYNKIKKENKVSE